MKLEKRIEELVSEYRVYMIQTPNNVLVIRSVTDIIIDIEKHIDIMQRITKANRHDKVRFEILLKCITRLQERHKKTIKYLYEIKKP
jgi:hypothetical protein